MTTERTLILEALAAWIAQRPGLDPRNYDRAGYRSDSRSITLDLNHARTLLAQVKWRDSITAEKLKAALRGSFSGRLSWVPVSVWHCEKCDCVCGVPTECCGGPMFQGGKLEYCTGQYWPTEYRRAVCAVLASSLWDYFRACMPAPNGMANRNGYECETYNGMSAGDYIRRTAKKELGKTIAGRFFR